VFAVRDQVDQSGQPQAFRIVDNSGAVPVRHVVVNPGSGTVDVKLKNGEESGSEVVIDYAKGVTGIYERSRGRCLLIAGVSKNVDSTAGAQSGTDAYPVKDSSLLPEALRGKCAGRPLNWVEATNEDEVKAKAGSNGKQGLERQARFWRGLAKFALKQGAKWYLKQNRW